MIKDFRNFLAFYQRGATPDFAVSLFKSSLKYYGFTIAFILLHLPIVALFWVYDMLGISRLVYDLKSNLETARKKYDEAAGHQRQNRS